MIFTRGLQVCLAAVPVDLRCGFDSLSAKVQVVLQESPISSRIFVFTYKRHDRVRLLYFDGTGLWLMTKRLEKGTFAWPKMEAGRAVWTPTISVFGDQLPNASIVPAKWMGGEIVTPLKLTEGQIIAFLAQ